MTYDHTEWQLEVFRRAVDGGHEFVTFHSNPGYPHINPAVIAEIGADFRNALGWAGMRHSWTYSADSAETDYWPSS